MVLAGCESDAKTGSLIGAGVGAGVGQAVGRDTESSLIGAAIGAGAGYILGNESDKKKRQSQPRASSPTLDEYVTVDIENPNGSVSQVKLKKQGSGYIGPKGEFYDHLPSAEELRQGGYGL